MKKVFTLIMLFFITTFSYAEPKNNTELANPFSKTLAFQIFWNDSLSIESYSSNSDFCLEERNKDVLRDGVEVFIAKTYYKLYSPKLKTIFTVRLVNRNASLGDHLIWLLNTVRQHDAQEFNVGYKPLNQHP